MAKFALESGRPALEGTRTWLAARPRALVAGGVFLATVLVLLLVIPSVLPSNGGRNALAVGDKHAAEHMHTQQEEAAGHVERAAAALPAQCSNSFFDPAYRFLSNMCMSFNKVCFDQGHVVSFDPAYSPANASSVALPKPPLEDLKYSWGGAEDNGDKFHNAIFNYEPLTIRPGGVLEDSKDLQQPLFSNCSVAVMWTMWVHNFGEGMSHIVTRVWRMWHDGALGNGTLVAIGTPPGEGVPSFYQFELKPFTTHPVLSFSELSSRTAAVVPGRKPTHPYGRCFETAHLCIFRDGGLFVSLYGAQQAVYEYYKAQLPPPPPEAQFEAQGDEVFNVLIEHREGSVRHLLNWKELVGECNAFSGWSIPEGSPIKRVQCRSATFTNDPLANLAAVRPADVLVIVHGSGCSNWLSMKHSAAMLEIRPFEFGTKARGWSDWFYPQIANNIQYAVHWYAINIEDPALSTPSEREKSGQNPDQIRYMRDRHTTLPFSALRKMLERIMATRRDEGEYLKLHGPPKRHYVELRPGGQLVPAT